MKLNIRHGMTAGLTAIALVAVTGCAQPPIEQLEAAQKAVDAAKAAGATEYAKEDLATLEQQFALAKEELAKQETALSVFRSYAEADKLLLKVVESGAAIATKATQNKEAAQAAAKEREKEAQQVVASAKELMAEAPTGKDKAAVEALKEDISGLEANLSAVHQLIEKGDYLGADAQAKALKEKASAVSGEIQKAIEKAGGKKVKAHA